mmetsp:Transcript_2724/g.3879  ORF Transcript_2724/g.3879 Transcript_2724/m.3879 type:complete len:98 (+) Transcript_2724:275-568(+)
MTVVEVNQNDAAENDKDNQPKLVKLILDMARPWFNTDRVLNMDNYYTSVQAFAKLRQNGIFARGTCRPNQKHFPEAVTFTKADEKAMGRGIIKVTSN